MAQDKIIYFDVKGRAEAVRIAMHGTEGGLEDERITMAEFAELKPTLPLKQLPVMEIQGTTVPQSTAHFVYAGMKSGLFPTDPFEAALVMQLICSVDEVATKLYSHFHMTDEAAKEKSLENYHANVFPLYMNFISNAITKHGKNGFCVGDELTIADLVLAVFIESVEKDNMRMLPKNLIDSYPVLKKHAEVVMAHPKVQAYYKAKAEKDAAGAQ